MAQFAELVFAYIDELSAASAAGHADELATTGRVRQRYWSGWPGSWSTGASPDDAGASAERAEWTPPATLTAVLLPPAQVRGAEAALGSRARWSRGRTCPTSRQRRGAPLLLVPDVGASGAAARRSTGRHAVVGPAVAWRRARSSYVRAVRARDLGLRAGQRAGAVDTDRHLAQLVLEADPEALADLRARALAPLAELRPASAEKLDRDAAGLAAVPGPPRGGRRDAPRAPADRALPRGPAAGAVRRAARRPGVRAGADPRAGRGQPVSGR